MKSRAAHLHALTKPMSSALPDNLASSGSCSVRVHSVKTPLGMEGRYQQKPHNIAILLCYQFKHRIGFQGEMSN